MLTSRESPKLPQGKLPSPEATSRSQAVTKLTGGSLQQPGGNHCDETIRKSAYLMIAPLQISSPVKEHHKVCKFATKCQNRPKTRVLSVQERAAAWKKYTTAGCGGCDKYQLLQSPGISVTISYYIASHHSTSMH